MSGSFEVNGDQVTVKFEYTANLAKVQQVITDAAHILWDRGLGEHGTGEAPILFDELNNQQKLDIVDQYVKQEILTLARNYITTIGQNAARVQAEQDAMDCHEL